MIGRRHPGESLTYTILLNNPGQPLDHATLTDTLPSGLAYAGSLWASSGDVTYDGGTVIWHGEVASTAPVTVRFDVAVSERITKPQRIVNTAHVDDGQGHVLQRQAVVIVNGAATYLPVVGRGGR